jgi:hypothetical protein
VSELPPEVPHVAIRDFLFASLWLGGGAHQCAAQSRRGGLMFQQVDEEGGWQRDDEQEGSHSHHRVHPVPKQQLALLLFQLVELHPPAAAPPQPSGRARARLHDPAAHPRWAAPSTD